MRVVAYTQADLDAMRDQPLHGPAENPCAVLLREQASAYRLRRLHQHHLVLLRVNRPYFRRTGYQYVLKVGPNNVWTGRDVHQVISDAFDFLLDIEALGL